MALDPGAFRSRTHVHFAIWQSFLTFVGVIPWFIAFKLLAIHYRKSTLSVAWLTVF
jgi:hypothetical protein